VGLASSALSPSFRHRGDCRLTASSVAVAQHDKKPPLAIRKRALDDIAEAVAAPVRDEERNDHITHG
jgi:hypothetical protein